MSEKRNRRIPVMVTESELGEIREKARQANLSVSGYIRTVALSGEQIVVVDRSAAIAGHLGNICTAVQELKYNCPGIRDNLGNVEKEVMELWHLLE